MAPSSAAVPQRIMIFDMMRARSHLFFRFMCTNPDLRPVYHPWLKSSFLGPQRFPLILEDRPAVTEWNAAYEKVRTVRNTYDEDAAALEDAVRDASRDGKIALINEHCCWVLHQHIVVDSMYKDLPLTLENVGTNPTRVPDWLLDTLTPIVVVRHPALYVQSEYIMILKSEMPWRPGDTGFAAVCAMRFSRMLFEFFRARGRQPMVVDGEDVVWRTQALVEGLCERLGLQPGSLKDTWEPLENPHEDPVLKAYTATIFESRGIIRPEGGKPGEPNIEDAVQHWKANYGEQVAEKLRQVVEENMPHYEYLKQFKV